MKELKEYSDEFIIICLINERRNDLNPYTPFAERLKKIAARLDHSELREKSK